MYMSPEQSRRAALDGRSALYAAGVVLWELLARHRLRSEPVDASMAGSFQSEIPADVEAVAMRLVAAAPEERYPTDELAAHDLLLCQAAPRDGRGELAPSRASNTRRSRRAEPWSADSNGAPSGERGAAHVEGAR